MARRAGSFTAEATGMCARDRLNRASRHAPCGAGLGRIAGDTQMENGRATRFIEALRQAETSGDPAPLAELFQPDAELVNLGAARAAHPTQDAREFWSSYLENFDCVRSEFLNVAEAPQTSILEWRSDGALRGGIPICYRGVSVIEWNGELVAKFRTYYDSAAFVRPHGEDAPREPA